MRTKRLLLMSDSHWRSKGQIPDEVARLAHQADFILHAGDVTREAVLDAFQAMASYVGALGNSDEPLLAQRLNEVAVEEILGHRFVVVHGWGSHHALVDRIWPRVKVLKPEVVVFGHSHRPEVTFREGTLFVNPGSIGDPRHTPNPTCAWLSVTEEAVGEPDFVELA